MPIAGRDPGAIYVRDRAWIDLRHVQALDRTCRCSATWAKKNFHAQHLDVASSDRSVGVMPDKTIDLADGPTNHPHPDQLRRIRYKDSHSNKTLASFHVGKHTIS